MKIARKQLQTFVAKSAQFRESAGYSEGGDNETSLTVTQERKQPADTVLRAAPDGYYVQTFQGDLLLFDAERRPVNVGNGFVDIGIPSEAQVKTYTYKKFRKPSNKISWDVGDPVARWMRDKTLDQLEQVIASGLDAKGVKLPYSATREGWADPDDTWTKYFHNRYSDMKHGPKRMAFGRVLRAHIKKTVEQSFSGDLLADEQIYQDKIKAALDEFANRN